MPRAKFKGTGDLISTQFASPQCLHQTCDKSGFVKLGRQAFRCAVWHVDLKLRALQHRLHISSQLRSLEREQIDHSKRSHPSIRLERFRQPARKPNFRMAVLGIERRPSPVSDCDGTPTDVRTTDRLSPTENYPSAVRGNMRAETHSRHVPHHISWPDRVAKREAQGMSAAPQPTADERRHPASEQTAARRTRHCLQLPVKTVRRIAETCAGSEYHQGHLVSSHCYRSQPDAVSACPRCQVTKADETPNAKYSIKGSDLCSEAPELARAPVCQAYQIIHRVTRQDATRINHPRTPAHCGVGISYKSWPHRRLYLGPIFEVGLIPAVVNPVYWGSSGEIPTLDDRLGGEQASCSGCVLEGHKGVFGRVSSQVGRGFPFPHTNPISPLLVTPFTRTETRPGPGRKREGGVLGIGTKRREGGGIGIGPKEGSKRTSEVVGESQHTRREGKLIGANFKSVLLANSNVGLHDVISQDVCKGSPNLFPDPVNQCEVWC
ncbi:hypothetical protein PR048_010987 [Dryococelus australis]|uniref:Uncharacterized protein n=1 Tax=Dryococelus australis TaxID=614101 RepID=A0ABQ9HKA8_9NEOP|nr:hypothetical protein PR048_010987 [Dryococelus australis]